MTHSILRVGTTLLINLITLLRTHSVRHQLAFPFPDEDLNTSVKIHEKIIQMCMDKNTDEKRLRESHPTHFGRASFFSGKRLTVSIVSEY